MDKNSTPAIAKSIVPPVIAADRQTTQERPRHATLERIRQFARAYTYIPTRAGLGGMVLN